MQLDREAWLTLERLVHLQSLSFVIDLAVSLCFDVDKESVEERGDFAEVVVVVVVVVVVAAVVVVVVLCW